jgi:Na+-translocating ferredoxin:NAD+ oxidoreductase RnfG subunit
LAFRESRGWEIRYPFFTKQFDQVSLTQKQKLNKTIDNITGATLSVRAVRKLAQLALIYHARVTPSND